MPSRKSPKERPVQEPLKVNWPKVVRGREVHLGIEMLSAGIEPKAKRVLADDFGHIVCELHVLRNGGPNLVLPDRGYGAIGENEGREGIGGGMRGDAYGMIEVQPEIGDGRSALNRETVILIVIGEAETEFVHQRGSDGIVVGSHHAAILLLTGPNIRQKIVGGAIDAGVVGLAIEHVLEAVAHVDLLLRIDDLIDAPGLPVRKRKPDCIKRFIG